MTAPDRSVSVQAELTGNGAFVVIANHTTNAMTWIATSVAESATARSAATVARRRWRSPTRRARSARLPSSLIPAVQNGPISTLTVSTEPSSSGGQTFVGQLLEWSPLSGRRRLLADELPPTQTAGGV